MGSTSQGQSLHFSLLATGVVVRFESKMAAAAYQSHPLHVHQIEVLKPLMLDLPDPLLVMDYVFDLKECPFGWKSFLVIGAAFGALCTLAVLRHR